MTIRAALVAPVVGPAGQTGAGIAAPALPVGAALLAGVLIGVLVPGRNPRRIGLLDLLVHHTYRRNLP